MSATHKICKRILPSHCISGRTLDPIAGVVVHYFSGRNVDPANRYDLEVCRNLFKDLNRPRVARQLYMREKKWPDKRMYASAHQLIDRDGELWQLVEYDMQAFHAGASILNGRKNCNRWTLGIELVGETHSGFTDIQYEVLAAELAKFRLRHRRLKLDAIAGHDRVRWNAIQAGAERGKKYDPSGRFDGCGDNFDWSRLYHMIEDIEALGSPRAEQTEV